MQIKPIKTVSTVSNEQECIGICIYISDCKLINIFEETGGKRCDFFNQTGNNLLVNESSSAVVFTTQPLPQAQIQINLSDPFCLKTDTKKVLYSSKTGITLKSGTHFNDTFIYNKYSGILNIADNQVNNGIVKCLYVQGGDIYLHETVIRTTNCERFGLIQINNKYMLKWNEEPALNLCAQHFDRFLEQRSKLVECGTFPGYMMNTNCTNTPN